MADLANAELLFGSIEAARQACENEAINQVENGEAETSPLVFDLDSIVTAIEAFQAAWGSDD